MTPANDNNSLASGTGHFDGLPTYDEPRQHHIRHPIPHIYTAISKDDDDDNSPLAITSKPVPSPPIHLPSHLPRRLARHTCSRSSGRSASNDTLPDVC
ncbi:uncharacterized protein ARMOST_08063 [Armillaria ostoyae]|uniref:Uncharacterized protein n=1 Tax=Armillaria ostoyae TaxID=47428 RepID=A0A284R7L4_ARMOS|nr:uncharacterized protein ARMOST_08063 [Armillaria ostoyae]